MTRPRQIFVSCTDGHIVLSGSVHGEEERRMAKDAAASIPGVTEVLNNIIALPRPGLSRFGGA